MTTGNSLAKYILPAPLNMEKLLLKHGHPEELKHVDRYERFVHIVFRAENLMKDFDKEADTWGHLSFVNLKAAYLRESIGRTHYKKIRQFLCNEGQVIFSDNRYVTGVKSIGYRIHGAYRTGSFLIVERNRELPKEKVNRRQGNLYGLDKHFRSLTFDKERAIRTAKWLNMCERFTPRQRLNYNMSIECFNDDFMFRDETALRLHTRLSSLPKPLRPFVSHPEGELVNIDIANAQPLLLNVVAQRYISPHKHTRIPLSLPDQGTPPTLYDGMSDKEDVVQFKRETESGKFYAYIRTRFRERGMELTEDEVKDKMMHVLYGKIPKRENRYDRIFREAFPTIRLFVDMAKGEMGEGNPETAKDATHAKADNHARLSIALQRLESYLVIDCVCKRMSIEHPEVFLATIHDSIVTLKRHSLLVREIIMEEFRKKYSLKPTLKDKPDFTSRIQIPSP